MYLSVNDVIAHLQALPEEDRNKPLLVLGADGKEIYVTQILDKDYNLIIED